MSAIEVCAGVVTYNPDLDVLKNNLESLCPQVKFLYVVDNGSKNVDEIGTLLNTIPNTQLYLNGDNLGIAQALNRLCGIAEKNGFHWILTMDQDSLCDPMMVENLCMYVNEEYGIIAQILLSKEIQDI